MLAGRGEPGHGWPVGQRALREKRRWDLVGFEAGKVPQGRPKGRSLLLQEPPEDLRDVVLVRLLFREDSSADHGCCRQRGSRT